MKTFGLLAVLALALASIGNAAPPPKRTASALTTFNRQIIPLVIVGEGWSQRLVLHNVDDHWSTAAKISFFTQAGQPFAVNVKGTGVVTTLNVDIGNGLSHIVDLEPSFAPQQLGWASLELYATSPGGGDFSGLGDVFGQVVYRKQTPGLPDFMCSMIFSGLAFEKMTAYFDNTGSNYTGMGILTSDTFTTLPAVPLHVTIRDIDGSVIGEKTITQNHGVLYWMNLGVDFPETAGRVGTFEVDVVHPLSVTLTGFSMQFAGNGAFTIVTPFEK